jgi:hypothetical protein
MSNSLASTNLIVENKKVSKTRKTICDEPSKKKKTKKYDDEDEKYSFRIYGANGESAWVVFGKNGELLDEEPPVESK